MTPQILLRSKKEVSCIPSPNIKPPNEKDFIPANTRQPYGFTGCMGAEKVVHPHYNAHGLLLTTIFPVNQGQKPELSFAGFNRYQRQLFPACCYAT